MWPTLSQSLNLINQPRSWDMVCLIETSLFWVAKRWFSTILWKKYLWQFSYISEEKLKVCKLPLIPPTLIVKESSKEKKNEAINSNAKEKLGLPSGKESACPMAELQETWVQSLSQGDPLEEVMATHSSILAWEIPWTEEPGGLQSMGLQRVGYSWALALMKGKIMRVKKTKFNSKLKKSNWLYWLLIQAASHLASKGEFQRATEMKRLKRQVKRLF